MQDEEGDILGSKKLEINASGLVGACRGLKDGVTFFGTQIKLDDKIVNDFLLNINNVNLNEIGTYVFIIYYRKETNKYCLRACKDKSNTKNTMLLIKLTNEYILNFREVISIGDVYLKIITNEGGSIEVTRLMGKVKDNM